MMAMSKLAPDTSLHRIDLQRNMFRFYSMSVQPNLFGGCSLIRAWGRIGTAGSTKIEFFGDDDAAENARCRLIRIKLSRGYEMTTDDRWSRSLRSSGLVTRDGYRQVAERPVKWRRR